MRFRACLLLTLLSLPCAAQVRGKMEGRTLVGGARRVMIIDGEGKVVWEHATALLHDAWMLPSGNVLYADGPTVTEVRPDHSIAWQYRPELQQGGGAFSCQRLPNGNTVVGENSTGRVLEVDAAGRIAFTLATSPSAPGQHHNMRMVRKLANGNYLVCHSGAHIVKEYKPDGAVAWEIKTPNLAFAAIRTKANTTLVSTLDALIEYDAKGEVVWKFEKNAIEGMLIRNMTGMHLMANGNIAVGCYSAYQNGEGTGLLEITRGGKLVWSYSAPKADSSMMAIERLDAGGKPLGGQSLR